MADTYATKEALTTGLGGKVDTSAFNEYKTEVNNTALKFYFGVYTENKYCYGVCGSMTNILPYSDEGKILADILERLIYLNISKNGY